MTELSDYRRMVEGPMVKRYEERIANLITEIERLRALASPQPSEEEVERVAKAVRRNLFVRTRRLSAFDETLPPTANELDDARAAIAAMSPRPQPGMISADRACEIVGAILEECDMSKFPAWIAYIREAINTIRMEAGTAPQTDGWQTIETAPKDGTEIIVYRPDAGVFMASFREGASDEDDGGECYWFSVEGEDLTRDLPTHWRPLPEPPKE